MKKLFLLSAALTALTLTACTGDEVVEIKDDNLYICFSTSIAPSTRTSRYDMIDSGYGAGSSNHMAVYGMKNDGTALFDGDGWLMLNSDGSFYNSDDIGKYKWPEGPVTFYGIGGFSVKDTPGTCESVNISTHAPKAAITKITTPVPVVPLTFHHLWSRIYVNVKNSRQDIFKISPKVDEVNGQIDSNIPNVTAMIIGDVVTIKNSGGIHFGLDENGEFKVEQPNIDPSRFKVSFSRNMSAKCYYWISDLEYIPEDYTPVRFRYGYPTTETTFDDAIPPHRLTIESPFKPSTCSCIRIQATYLSAANDAEVWKGDLYIPTGDVLLEPGKLYTFNIDLGKGGYIEDPDNAGTYVKLFEKLPIMGFATSLYDWDVEPGVDVSVN